MPIRVYASGEQPSFFSLSYLFLDFRISIEETVLFDYVPEIAAVGKHLSVHEIPNVVVDAVGPDVCVFVE